MDHKEICSRNKSLNISITESWLAKTTCTFLIKTMKIRLSSSKKKGKSLARILAENSITSIKKGYMKSGFKVKEEINLRSFIEML